MGECFLYARGIGKRPAYSTAVAANRATRRARAMIVSIGGFPIDFGNKLASAT